MNYIRIINIFLLYTGLLFGQQDTLSDTDNSIINSDQFYADKCVDFIKGNDDEKLGKCIQNWINYRSHEPSERMLMLWNIYNGKNQDFANKNIIQNMLICRAVKNNFVKKDTVFYLPHQYSIDYPILKNSFEKSTVDFARKLTEKDNLTDEEMLISKYYADQLDSIFIIIQNKNYRKSALNKAYKDYVNDIIKDSFSIKFGLITGMWIPTDNLKILGNHISTGFQMGGMGLNGWGLTLSMLQRYQNSKDSLALNFSDTIRYTNRYLGGFYGLDLSRSIYSTLESEIEISAGVALDGFLSTFDMPEEFRFVQTNISSVNFNFGLAYRYVIEQKYYIEMQIKYNIFDYKVNDGVDLTGNMTKASNLSGNAFNINLNIGLISGGKRRRDILRHLDYKF